MMVCIKTGIALASSMLFFGCTTSQPEPAPSVVPDAPAVEKADAGPAVGTVTLIRTEAEPTAPSVQVIVQNEIVADINNYSFVTFELPAGLHLLTFNWPDTPITFDDEIAVELEGGDHKYISVMHRIEIPDYQRNEDGVDYTMAETLAVFELPAKLARGVIRNLVEARAEQDEL